MARVGLFENDPCYIDLAAEAIHARGHDLTLVGTDIGDAFGAMRDLIDERLALDALVVDGTLDNRDGISSFEYVHEGDFVVVAGRKRLLRKPEPDTLIQKVTSVEIDTEYRTQAHARTILKIVDVFGLGVKKIGFSSSSLYLDAHPNINNGKYIDGLARDIDRALAGESSFI